MIDKYKAIQRDIFRYIQNRLAVYTTPEQIAREVEDKFPTWIIYSQLTPEMKLECIEVLCNQSKWLSDLYSEPKTKETQDGTRNS